VCPLGFLLPIAQKTKVFIHNCLIKKEIYMFSRIVLRTLVAVTMSLTTLVSAVSSATTLQGDSSKNIVEIAKSAGTFNTLVAAVEAAGLAPALTGNDQLTVFAPTDAAFAKLPAGTVQALLKDIPTLKSILLYHVSPSRQSISRLQRATTVETLQGSPVVIEREQPRYFTFSRSGKVTVNGVNVVAANIAAKNGMIHVIDEVLLPAKDAPKDVMSLVDILKLDGRFKTLLAALDATGLTPALTAPGEFTLLAPTDAAFAKLPAGTVPALLKDLSGLKSILLYHTLGQEVDSRDLLLHTKLNTLQGKSITVHFSFSGIQLNNANFVNTDLQSPNGIIHAIDAVLIPPAANSAAAFVGKKLKIVNRVENGVDVSLPKCAEDDTLEFNPDGTFNSLIGGTQCNPSEVDVVGGQYLFSADGVTIKFSVPGFEYEGKIISANKQQIIIEFDLGPGFLIRDTFQIKR
jgi:transforming growth factor-beta-induced protein